MSSSEIVSGVGARYGVVFVNDTTAGYPLPNAASATPDVGVEVQGIKTMPVSDPTPQRISHYGNDGVIAQDSLPGTEAGSFSVTTAKSNMTLDAVLEGAKVRTINTVVKMRAANSDNKGNEPLVTFMAYRQALDTQRGSGTFGKLRQYQGKIYPSARFAVQSQEFAQAETDKTYEATPTPVQFTSWNEELNSTNWGVARGEYIEFNTTYHPRLNVYRGNGTLVAFALSHTPVSSAYLHVWSDGTLATPSAVNTTAANPAFTLSVAPGVDKQVFALIETQTPNQS